MFYTLLSVSPLIHYKRFRRALVFVSSISVSQMSTWLEVGIVETKVLSFYLTKVLSFYLSLSTD